MDFDAQKIHFDVVIRAPRYETWKHLWRALNKRCKKFKFQKEEGEKREQEHWQCRVTLYKKLTAFAMNTEIIPEIGGLWSLTSNPNTDNDRYVTKWPTRIEGPWDEKTPCPDEHPLTQDLKTFMELGLLPWHEEALKYATSYNERDILAVHNQCGNAVKTRFLKWLCYKGIANWVPPTMDTTNQLMQFVFGQEVRKCYVFNIVRSQKQDGRALAKIFTAIECIKDGYLYDTRHKTQEKWIETPQIIVVFNHIPDLDMLSADRWKIMEIHGDTYTMKTAYDYMIGEPDKPGSYQTLSSYEKSKKSEKSSFLIKKRKNENNEKSKVARAM